MSTCTPYPDDEPTETEIQAIPKNLYKPEHPTPQPGDIWFNATSKYIYEVFKGSYYNQPELTRYATTTPGEIPHEGCYGKQEYEEDYPPLDTLNRKNDVLLVRDGKRWDGA